MPNLGPLDAELRVPIDYISLREISEADHQALIQRERLYSGYYEIGLPKDEPEILPDYPDPRLVTYSRDPMRPIFSDTKPNADELTDQLTERTAAGEIVTLAAGLYSPEGIGHLRFEISALINSQTQDTISAANVEPFEVRLKDARLDYADTRRFATIPDHLAALSSLHIPAQSSRSIWFKIHVPLSASGSYAGEVVIKSQDEFVGRFKIILHVVPQLLDQSSHLNPVWLDPWLSDGRIACLPGNGI